MEKNWIDICMSHFMRKRMGVLDIGSNSVKLLVADFKKSGGVRDVLQQSESPRLAEGFSKTSRLSPAAMARTFKVIKQFLNECKNLDVQEWRVTATSAVREARNQQEFIGGLKREAGLNLRVLSGEEEGALIFHGAISDPKLIPSSGNVFVMDVGGGSAEFIFGSSSRIQWNICLPAGCVRMTDRFLRGDPFTPDSLQALTNHYLKSLLPLKKKFQGKDFWMIGTGGSICTAAAVCLQVKSTKSPKLHGCRLTLPALEALLEELTGKTQAERLRMKYLSPKRADIIVAGLTLFVTTMRLFKIPVIRISLRGLRYGILTCPSSGEFQISTH